MYPLSRFGWPAKSFAIVMWVEEMNAGHPNRNVSSPVRLCDPLFPSAIELVWPSPAVSVAARSRKRSLWLWSAPRSFRSTSTPWLRSATKRFTMKNRLHTKGRICRAVLYRNLGECELIFGHLLFQFSDAVLSEPFVYGLLRSLAGRRRRSGSGARTRAGAVARAGTVGDAFLPAGGFGSFEQRSILGSAASLAEPVGRAGALGGERAERPRHAHPVLVAAAGHGWHEPQQLAGVPRVQRRTLHLHPLLNRHLLAFKCHRLLSINADYLPAFQSWHWQTPQFRQLSSLLLFDRWDNGRKKIEEIHAI